MLAPLLPNTDVFPASVNVQLADYLDAQKEMILNEWIAHVRGDASIVASDSLSTSLLKEHLPDIFDDLIKTLRLYGGGFVADKTSRDAEEHGARRLRQGYELPEMLRELMHLRDVLNCQVREFEVLHAEFGMASRLFISNTLHRFIDEMMIESAEQYLWARMNAGLSDGFVSRPHDGPRQ